MRTLKLEFIHAEFLLLSQKMSQILIQSDKFEVKGPLPEQTTRCSFLADILVTSFLSDIICQLTEEQSDASTLLSFAVQKVPLVSFQNVTVWIHLLLHLQLHTVYVENPATVKSPYIDKSCRPVLRTKWWNDWDAWQLVGCGWGVCCGPDLLTGQLCTHTHMHTHTHMQQSSVGANLTVTGFNWSLFSSFVHTFISQRIVECILHVQCHLLEKDWRIFHWQLSALLRENIVLEPTTATGHCPN